MASVVEFAESYVTENKLARTPIYSANRFARMLGDMPIESVTDKTLKKFRQACEDGNLSAWTVKCGLKDLRTLVRASGRDIGIDRIATPEPDPKPVELRLIDAIFPHLEPWSQQWLVLSYWCGFRLADSIRFQQSITADTKTLQWKAKKTNRKHNMTVPRWIERFMRPVVLPYRTSMDWSEARVRMALAAACQAAGIDQILPSQIRDTSLREWCRADFHVGQVVHGCKMGVIGHYVLTLDVIDPVAPRVRLPECFGGESPEKRPEAELVEHFRKLDPQARDLVLMTAQRMSR
jgi:hypothetical protein